MGLRSSRVFTHQTPLVRYLLCCLRVAAAPDEVNVAEIKFDALTIERLAPQGENAPVRPSRERCGADREPAARDRVPEQGAGRQALRHQANDLSEEQRPRRARAPCGSPQCQSPRRRPRARTTASSSPNCRAHNRPRVREQGILPARPLLKPSKITVQAVCCRRATDTGQGDKVNAHAKTTYRTVASLVSQRHD